MREITKKKSKLIFSLFLFVFFFVISVFYWDEYIKFHNNINYEIENNKIIQKKINSFSLEKINKLNYVDFKYTPNKEVLDLIISKISNAKKRVYLEVYIFTEKRIRESVKKAKTRGLDVKVLLEAKPYMAPNLNKKTFNYFKQFWVNVVWSNSKNFFLNHSKIMIVDNELILSTWNYSYSNFVYNRDFFLFINDNNLLNILLKIFNNDFEGKNKIFYNDNLVLSPNYSRFKIEYLLKSAKKEIKMYFPYIKDKRLENILFDQIKKWIDIKLIVSINTLKKIKK